jgi:Holliday junction DNA helicase RuvA
MALNLISVMGEQKLSNAIANSDIGSLTAVPGIGKKGAQRLILELSDKIASPKNSAITSWRESLITALVGLGWNRKDASSAAEQVPTPENEADLSDSLRTALKLLSKTR